MSKYHIIIQDLISEVTFKKVEGILQVGQDFFKSMSSDLMCHKWCRGWKTWDDREGALWVQYFLEATSQDYGGVG